MVCELIIVVSKATLEVEMERQRLLTLGVYDV